MSEVQEQKSEQSNGEVTVEFTTSPVVVESVDDAAEHFLDKINEKAKAFDPTIEQVQALPSSQGKLERTQDEIDEVGEEKLVNVKVNPQTGEHVIIDGATNEEETKVISQGLQTDVKDLMNKFDVDTNIEVDDKPVSAEELKSAIDDSIYHDEMGFNLSDQGLVEFLAFINKRKQNPGKSGAYHEAPSEVQDMIDDYVKKMGFSVLSREGKTARNRVTEALVDEFIMTIDTQRITKDFNSEIESIFEKGQGELADSIIGFTSERNETYRKYAEELEDEEKKKKMLEILDSIEEGFKLTDLKEFSKKCKIKKIDIDKPGRIFNYVLDKYRNSNYNIYNIEMALPILYRNINRDLKTEMEMMKDFDSLEKDLKDEIEDKVIEFRKKQIENPVYTEQQCLAFFVAFCKQCMNMNSSVATDHAYIYYVLYNIVLIDLNKGKSMDVSDSYLSNIKEVIANLIERNPWLKES